MRDKVEEFKAVAKEYIGVFTWFLLNVAAIVLIVFVGAYATFLKPILNVVFAFRNETLTISMIAGISIGACSHAVGTSKAIELGETEGAMSGLAIGVCGILTVLFSMILIH